MSTRHGRRPNPPPVFSSAWFLRHQRALLAGLNAPVIGGELRAALAIRRGDVGADGRIVGILPHAYVVQRSDGVFVLDCRTHAKFAKRLYHAFLPVWRAAHAWDQFLAEPLIPALDLGFNTLTVFPDANPETTSVDGITLRTGVSEAWATIIAGAGNSADDLGDNQGVIELDATGTSNLWLKLTRSPLLFDTSGLTSAAVISAAVLSIFGTGKTDDVTTVAPNIDIYTTTPASNTALVAADFTQFGAVSQTGSPISFASWNTAAYNDFTLNGTGQGNVSKTGVSKFGARNANYDVSGSVPTWTANSQHWLSANFADHAGTSNDPKLVVTFTLPANPVVGPYGLWQSNVLVGGL